MDNKISAHPAAISIGKRLKEAREKKPLTIEQVQKQTKIHSSVLKALEDGHASALLTDTYVRSFLKKYSQILGLPTADILKEYFPPYPESGVPLNENPLPHETRAHPRMLYFTGIAVFGIAAAIVVFLIGAKLVSSFNKAGLTHQEKRVAAASAAKKKQPKSAKPAQKKKAGVKAGSGAKDIIPRSEQLKLTISVKETILVTLKRDGVIMYSVIMKKGTVDKISANENIELDVLKTDALDLALNGQQIAMPPGKNINGVIITRKGVRLK